MAHLDDILIYSNNEKKHASYMLKVLKYLHKQSLQVDIDKREFSTKKVKYLSIIITIESIEIDAEKIDAIQR